MNILFAIAITLCLFPDKIFAAINIVPKPMSLQAGSGQFQIPKSMVVSADAGSATTSLWLKKMFSQAGITYNDGPASSAQVILTLDANLDSLGPEGYRLTISTNGIAIAAPNATGQFYALQTLRQLLPSTWERPGITPSSPISIPVLVILDRPRHPWRGIMLDPARRFIAMTYLKQTVDRMALYKLNRLHLHLSDDQGWRLEIKSWPKLATYGGSTQVGGGAGGYYTQAEMKTFIRYAADRRVVVFPEFDMPGHTQAALASYPTLACAGVDTSLNTGTKVGFSSLCVGQPAVTTFLGDVMREVAALFPAPNIHIGGDESKSTSPADFKTFIRAAEQVINANGKTMIGWDDIDTVRVNAATLIQSWHNTLGNINSHKAELYLDYPNQSGDTSTFPAAPVTLQKVYSAVGGSLGLEAPLWGEYLQNQGLIDRQLFPRALAVAEVGWAQTNNNFTEFKARIADQGARLDAMGIHWATNDTLVTWTRGTTYATYTSMFDGFDPSSNVGVTWGKRPGKSRGSETFVDADRMDPVDLLGRIQPRLGNPATPLLAPAPLPR